MGIDLVQTKLLAFALGASFSGFAGALWASMLQFIDPFQFDFSISIIVLSMIILGGIGNIWGVIFGGVVLGFYDRVLTSEATNWLHGLGARSTCPSSAPAGGRRPQPVQVRDLRAGAGHPDADAARRHLSQPPARGRAARRRRPRTDRRQLGEEALGRAHRWAACAPDRRMADLLVAKGITKRFGGLIAVNSVDFTHPGARHRQPDRTQRRRQDHVLQHDRRPVHPDQRQNHLRADRRSPAANPTRSPGSASRGPSRTSDCSPR